MGFTRILHLLISIVLDVPSIVSTSIPILIAYTDVSLTPQIIQKVPPVVPPIVKLKLSTYKGNFVPSSSHTTLPLYAPY